MIWTPAADRTLRAVYSEGGIHAAQAAFPRLRAHELYKRTGRLGVYRRPRWTLEDDRRLRRMWGEESLPAIAKALGRTRITVYWRAQKIGLPLGPPRHREYLTHAARRTGFDVEQLRRILRWARVGIYRHFSRQAQVSVPLHTVDSLDVDDAIARWMTTETLESAARRYDVDGESMRRWLRAAGVTWTVAPVMRGRNPGPHQHCRVLSADIDRAMTARAAHISETETLCQAAERIGVTRQTMRAWLDWGRVRVGRGVRALRADVDRVAAERFGRDTCRARKR